MGQAPGHSVFGPWASALLLPGGRTALRLDAARELEPEIQEDKASMLRCSNGEVCVESMVAID